MKKEKKILNVSGKATNFFTAGHGYTVRKWKGRVCTSDQKIAEFSDNGDFLRQGLLLTAISRKTCYLINPFSEDEIKAFEDALKIALKADI